MTYKESAVNRDLNGGDPNRDNNKDMMGGWAEKKKNIERNPAIYDAACSQVKLK